MESRLRCGDKFWYLNGKLHRENGPAIERANGYEEWYLNGEKQQMENPMNESEEYDYEQQYGINLARAATSKNITLNRNDLAAQFLTGTATMQNYRQTPVSSVGEIDYEAIVYRSFKLADEFIRQAQLPNDKKDV